MRCNKGGRKYYWLLLLLAGASCTTKQSNLAKLLSDPANGLVQVKKVNNKTIVMQVMPSSRLTEKNETAGAGFYKVKLALRTTESIKGNAAMQYMNFNIKNSFYAVQGSDTLPCAICERIPGINDREYLYMTFFNKPVKQNGEEANLHLVVADTIAGFGITDFEIKSEMVKKLEAIK